jgi:hypothetical protein
MAYKTPKYPRVQVSTKRHEKLTKEANKLNISVTELVEQKLKLVDKK